MTVMTISAASIFAVLSVIFGAFSARDYLRNHRRLSPAACVWLRISAIFAAVALILTVAI